MNARLVVKLASELDLSDAQISNGLQAFNQIPGRMEEIVTKEKFRVVVDFAHTPDGLKAALSALREQLNSQKKPGRLIAVFGCAGLRDVGKRPVMGRQAAELADLSVFTAEDPRTENIWTILRQMKSELGNNHGKVLSIADRYQAIKFTLQQLAKPGDLVAILGKGHEKSMCYGTTEYPWSDQNTVREVLGA